MYNSQKKYTSCGAVFPDDAHTSADASHRLLTLGPKTCSRFTSFTSWLITGELSQETVCEELQDYEECSWYLANRKIPEDTGWIPEPLALIPDDGWRAL